MKQLFTRYDIMELLCLTRWKFYDVAKRLDIDPIEKFGKMSCYTMQDMILIYNYVYVLQRTVKYEIIDSKINYKEIPL